MPVNWTRSYRSNAIKDTATGAIFAEPADGPLGFGWMTPYFARIENGDTYVDEDGVYTTFAKDASGNFLTDLDDGLILKKTASGYELVEIGGRIFTVNTDGRLISIKDLRGNAVTLGYNADGKTEWVKDATGHQVLTFTYNAAKRIDSATDFAGRIINYEYDQIGRIIKVKQAGITTAVYTYNNYHGITSKANALNETYTIEYEYPDKGIVKRIMDPVGTEMINDGQPPEGHEKTFGYDFANKTFYTTDGRGVTKKKIVNESGALLLQEEINGADATPTKKIEYLANKIGTDNQLFARPS